MSNGAAEGAKVSVLPLAAAVARQFFCCIPGYWLKMFKLELWSDQELVKWPLYHPRSSLQSAC